jgi:hypothetical protein
MLSPPRRFGGQRRRGIQISGERAQRAVDKAGERRFADLFYKPHAFVDAAAVGVRRNNSSHAPMRRTPRWQVFCDPFT